jgi:hypothetical protein
MVRNRWAWRCPDREMTQVLRPEQQKDRNLQYQVPGQVQPSPIAPSCELDICNGTIRT